MLLFNATRCFVGFLAVAELFQVLDITGTYYDADKWLRWTYMFCCLSWGTGETVRFGAFMFDNYSQWQCSCLKRSKAQQRLNDGAWTEQQPVLPIIPETITEDDVMWIRTVRYNVGTLIFPIGATCEWLLVLQTAILDKNLTQRENAAWLGFLGIMIVMWPIGLGFLFTALITQKRKHYKLVSSRMGASSYFAKQRLKTD